MRLAIVANGTKGFLRTKETIRSAERLNDVLVVDDLIQEKRVHPLGVKTSEHLIDNDKQVKAFLALCIDTSVWFLVRKAR